MEKKPKEFALEYAGFWIRLGAGVIDLLILGFMDGFIAYFFPPPIIWLTSGVGISIAYLLGFWIWRGQTPGKMAVGVKIIRTDSSPVKWQCALCRLLGYIVSVITLFIGFVWAAFDSRKQGLHDKIADTYVVKLPVRQVAFTGSYARGGIGCA
ncbi:MAG: RDD family protein [Chloroflexota bacterium]|nr:MAG: RDD family protein [Chloroflexota bacterium]